MEDLPKIAKVIITLTKMCNTISKLLIMKCFLWWSSALKFHPVLNMNTSQQTDVVTKNNTFLLLFTPHWFKLEVLLLDANTAQKMKFSIKGTLMQIWKSPYMF